MRPFARTLLVVAVGAGLVLAAVRFRLRAGSPSAADTKPSPAASAPAAGVVCFGTVDLEGGVASLTAVQPGRVTEVLVAENQHVAAGVELIRLDDDAARARVAEAEAAVALARQQQEMARKQPDIKRIRVAAQQAILDATHSRVEAARRVLEREQRLAKSAIITDSDRTINQEKIREAEAMERSEKLRLAELESQDAEADARRAEVELQAAEARRQQAEAALEGCRVKAPRAGTVLRILVGPGDVLSGQPAILFAADGPRVIRATVEQEFAGRVREGMPATVRDDADPSVACPGRVTRVAGWYSQRRTILHDPSQLSDVRTLECLIALDASQPRLRLGQSVRIFIGTAPR